ncbi:DUF3313 domain-containing protein [Agrobacterium tumefaciens]|uniref:DUF3313 domain-containing protein n=1 Tax=Rhizobium TaxID=379 RepID=UPI0002170A32|nr:DUF3313 domain-containing protein [Rhizobium sp. X9]EGP56179.1 hypothetical protein Agau_L101842 [Agrobacterium tumefaciens F2]QCM08078.1 DUF3313 domain-containing protein [Agrobacterium tumefaciens]CUX46139.1 conserved hypothetical protein [Agrobacterium genomosp. 5 str. CFBP 6626]HBT70360.1 DUF3313 domain-containing protein [Agrobacterium sp.]WKL21802.1 DUF3313 domain-containing protein [Agrobacterium tumefaciens]
MSHQRNLFPRPSGDKTARSRNIAFATLPFAIIMSGCTSVPLKEGGTLTSYAQLSPAKGKFTKSRIFVDAKGLAAVKTVAIVPTTFSFAAAARVTSEKDRTLVSNALDRAVCVALSDKYRIAALGQPADMTVRTVITDLVPTDKTMAGVSTAVSLGSNFVLPVGVPRLPVGLGGLAVEAEAVDNAGVQRAAAVWSKGANSFTDSARVSQIGDAYGLAADFANHFARILVTGKESEGLDMSLPSGHRIKSALGGKPKYAECDAYGRSRGLQGMVADQFGAPPEWTEKDAKPRPQ